LSSCDSELVVLTTPPQEGLIGIEDGQKTTKSNPGQPTIFEYVSSVDEYYSGKRFEILEELFERGDNVVDSDFTSISGDDILLLQQQGVQVYIEELINRGDLTDIDGQNLLSEVLALNNLFKKQASFSQLADHVQNRLQAIRGIDGNASDIEYTFQYLMVNNEFLSLLKKQKGISNLQKKDGAYCNRPGWFCPIQEGQTSIGVLTVPIITLTVGTAQALVVAPAGIAITAAVAPPVLAYFFLYQFTCGSLKCDDCGPATGIYNIRNVNSACDFGDFLAYGGSNVFEEVEEFRFFIDFPGANIPSLSITQNDRLLLKSSIIGIDNASVIDMRVDVVCDDVTVFEWPYGEENPRRFDISSHIRREIPTIIAPVTTEYYYEAGTPICFTLTPSPVWSIVEWGAVDGTPSSSEIGESSFYTVFSGDSPMEYLPSFKTVAQVKYCQLIEVS
jgi:hypothetical protein